MSVYGDIENLAEAFFGEDITCEYCESPLEDVGHEPDCPLTPENKFFDEELSITDEMEG